MELGTTLTQHILSQQRLHPQARGELTGLLTQIGVVAKVVTSQIRQAGLINIIGSAGHTNIQGEDVQKLDELANRTMLDTLARSGYVAAMASEEEDDWVEVKEEKRGTYIVLFDPLDGSSNIDANISIGTIFSIYRKASGGYDVTRRDFLRPGREQVAAGYAIYGSSTMFIYTTGHGVHGFTLDPTVGEFLLSHPDIRIPEKTKSLSVNQANEPYWPKWVHEFVKQMLLRNDDELRRVSGRHIGSLVADFHRNLLQGGVFLYPADSMNREGKLRLLYECAPMAMIAEQAGGAASDGDRPILDLVGERLHQRTTLIIGNREAVELATKICSGNELPETGLESGSYLSAAHKTV